MNRSLALGIGTSVALLAAGGGVMVVAWNDDTAAPVFVSGITAMPPDQHPQRPDISATLSTYELPATGSGTAATVNLAERRTRRFSLLGITWNDPAAVPDGVVEVRTRSIESGKWSGWKVLEVEEGGADKSSEGRTAFRGATDPIWVGPSDGVAARIRPADGSSPTALPEGLRLDLIDPGKPGGTGGGEPDPSASPSPSTSEPTPASEPVTSTPTTSPATTAPPTTAPTTTLPVPSSTAPIITPLPSYVSRAAWSADETLVTSTMTYASEVKVVFVHHTAGSNTYDCADSPDIVRAIQKYHVQSRGWADIGYNFLVDKCGTLFEGRRGGVTKAVIGAHTYGFNAYSAGIAVLGNYSTAAAPAAAEKIIARVAAARLGAYQHNPATTATLTENAPDGKFKQGQAVEFQRISGHRDAVNTECPGNDLYAGLPAIRALAVNLVSGLSALPLGGGGSLASGVYYAPGAVTVNWTVATPSNLLSRFDLLLDGKVAGTAPATSRAAHLDVPAGSHTVAVRAVQLYGATATTTAAKVFGDVTAPAFPGAPAVVLRAGTYSATAIPVTVNYRATDNVRVGSLTAASPSRATLQPTSASWNTGVRPSAPAVFTLTATDWAGNTRTASVTRRAVPLAETTAKRAGTWTTRTGSSYLGGKALAATSRNAKLTWTFTGRSAALLFSQGAKTGKAAIYLDGKKIATIDTTRSTTAYRQSLWVRTLTPAKHTVTVVALGTSGRPTVVSDGLVYIP